MGANMQHSVAGPLSGALGRPKSVVGHVREPRTPAGYASGVGFSAALLPLAQGGGDVDFLRLLAKWGDELLDVCAHVGNGAYLVFVFTDFIDVRTICTGGCC